MRKLLGAIIASTFALGSIAAYSAELTDQERTELRQRAERMQTQRVQNPGSPQDDVKLNRNRSDVRLDNRRSDVKAKVKNPKKAKRSGKRDGKKKRSLRDLPGALVR